MPGPAQDRERRAQHPAQSEHDRGEMVQRPFNYAIVDEVDSIVIDEARSARRRHEVVIAEPPERVGSDDTDALLDAIIIEEALATLSSEHRAVIISAYYGGRSVAQAANELGIPEGTVKSRLHYGMRALRLALQERGMTR